MAKRVSGRTLPLLLGIAFALVGNPAAAGAQQSEVEVDLRGEVVDAFSGAPVPGAVIVLGNRNRGAFTDRNGRFSVRGVEPGSYSVTIVQLGYDTLRTDLAVEERPDPVTFRLEPDPIELERVVAMVDQFAANRNRLGTSVRVFDRGRLATSTAFNALEFVQTRSALFLTRCPNMLAMGPCAFVRGRPVEVQVILDGARLVGGLDVLAAVRPEELYTLEIIGGGRAIRAYTTWYAESIAKGRRVPHDFFW